MYRFAEVLFVGFIIGFVEFCCGGFDGLDKTRVR